MEGSLETGPSCLACDLGVVEQVVMASSLDQHVEGPPTPEGTHTQQDSSVDPANLLEYLREGQYSRSDGSACHAQNTASQTAFLHFTEVSLA